MYDVLYVLGTIAFFALMLAYVRGCERLGRAEQSEDRHP
jgi:hypothetical protein